jgi:hypothetical protein
MSLTRGDHRQAAMVKRAIEVLPEALGMKRWREIRVGDLSTGASDPLELYLFDPASSLADHARGRRPDARLCAMQLLLDLPARG